MFNVKLPIQQDCCWLKTCSADSYISYSLHKMQLGEQNKGVTSCCQTPLAVAYLSAQQTVGHDRIQHAKFLCTLNQPLGDSWETRVNI